MITESTLDYTIPCLIILGVILILYLTLAYNSIRRSYVEKKKTRRRFLALLVVTVAIIVVFTLLVIVWVLAIT